MLNIALVGFGKLNQVIANLAHSKECQVIETIDPNNTSATSKTIDVSRLKDIKVAIDFSHPDVVVNNIEILSKLKINLVIGTTGWYGHLDHVKELCLSNDIGLIYAPNFSLGVNLFLRVLRKTGTLFNNFNDYDVAGFEVHHNEKVDSPSGTAQEMARAILETVDRKTTPLNEVINRKIKPHELHVPSLRLGSIPGTHSISFDSSSDTITITHQARNREGFALGALTAAKWIQNKKGFFSIDDLMEEIITN